MFSSKRLGDNNSTPFTNRPTSLLKEVLSFKSSNSSLDLLAFT